jgi:beta-lactamase class A
VAAPPTPEAALERLLSADKPSPEWFAPSFLGAIPITRVAAILDEMHASDGRFKSARRDGSAWAVELERGSARAEVTLDSEGRFTRWLIVPETPPKTLSLEEALADFRKLPGKVSVLVTGDRADEGSIDPDAPLAVGSAFKLVVLAALRTEVDAKKRSWRDIVELRPDARSLPSGILQDWPDRSPLTLSTLAALMISRSDNTAADVLAAVVGRPSLERLSPRNKPFLTTREAFLLKATENADVLARFRRGDEAAKRAVLDELRARPAPRASALPKEPTALDVEWWLSARELCGLISRVQDLSVMRIQPGVVRRDDFDSVAHKGGSEPGVLNLTTWVEKAGHSHCVAATYNADQKLDDKAFTRAYLRIVSWLKQ